MYVRTTPLRTFVPNRKFVGPIFARIHIFEIILAWSDLEKSQMRLLSHDSQMKVLKCGKSDNCFIEFIHFLAISDAKLFHSFCLCESVNVSEHFSVEGVKNPLFGKQGLTSSSLDNKFDF